MDALVSKKRMLCSDLDGTLLGDGEALRRFELAWARARSSGVAPVLCYNTGRAPDDALALIPRAGLPAPDHLIAGVGTHILDLATGADDALYARELASRHWDVRRVAEVLRTMPRVRPQPPECNSALKSSWFLEHASDHELDRIEDRLRAAGIEYRLIYSSARDLDLLPVGAGKGNALMRLASTLGVAHEDILVAGDSGNDAEMFAVPGVHGVIVANRGEELDRFSRTLDASRIHRASRVCAGGVHEALERLGWLAAG